MVVTVTRLRTGQHNYHLQLTEDYYFTKGGEPPGLWAGSASEVLGVAGEVRRPSLSSLMDGYHPESGHPLARNAGRASRRIGFEVHFAPPKSVSLLWSLGDTQESTVARKIQDESVVSTLSFLEKNLLFTRTEKDGALRHRAAAVYTVFEHGSSRPAEKGETPDPQLHHHALFPNVAWRPQFDGGFGTLDFRDVFRQKYTLDAFYNLSLATQFQRAGAEISRGEKDSWEIRGFSREAIRFFSKRRDKIESVLEKEFLSCARAREKANLHTRHYKKPRSRAELKEAWKQIALERFGITQAHIRSFFSNKRALLPTEGQVQKVLSAALDRVTEQDSHFSFMAFLRFAAIEALGTGADPDKIVEESRRFLSRDQIVQLGEFEGETHFTTKDILEKEKRLLSDATKTLSKVTRHTLHEKRVTQAIRKTFRDFSPNEEQQAAIHHLTEETGALKILTGGAGTGKSTVLSAVREAYESAGYDVLGATIAARTARGLERDTGIKSSSIAKLLKQIEHSSLLSRIKENLSVRPLLNDLKVGRGLRNREPTVPSPKLSKRTVLVVDEAGMVGTDDMARLIDEVKRARGKIILVGDTSQLMPIARGLPMQTLSEEVGEKKLTTIVRQKEGWAREAVKAFERGEARKALAEFSARGLISVAPTTDAAIDELVSDWLLAPSSLSEKLVLAPTHRVIREINSRIQEARKDDLGSGSLSVKDGLQVRVGDRVLFEKNSGPAGVDNGDTGTVSALNGRAKTVSVRLDRGGVVTVSLKKYADLSLGYCVSVHKAQGMTVDDAFFFAGGPMITRELAYVGASRARFNTRIYTSAAAAGEDLSDLARQMSTPRPKRLAIDITEERNR